MPLLATLAPSLPACLAALHWSGVWGPNFPPLLMRLPPAHQPDGTRVTDCATDIRAPLAACQVLVVVDSLRPHLALWRSICRSLTENHVPVSPEEEGSQQRQYAPMRV